MFAVTLTRQTNLLKSCDILNILLMFSFIGLFVLVFKFDWRTAAILKSVPLLQSLALTQSNTHEPANQRLQDH